MRSGPAYVTPQVLRWARESVALDLPAAAAKITTSPEKLGKAERGEALLTLRQAELAAEAYGRSLASLFRSKPPDEPSLQRRFRMLRGAPQGPWSHELAKLERNIRGRQDAMVEVYSVMGEQPPWLHVSGFLRDEHRGASPDVVRELLGLQPPALRLSEPGRSLWYSRKVVVRAVEWAGVLVIRAPVPDPLVRGFLLPHAEVPAIYVNSVEDPRAQAFTIIHEFAHLLVAPGSMTESKEEVWCNRFAGEVLMPADPFVEFLRGLSTGDPIARATTTAREFGVTPFAAATRARLLNMFSAAEVNVVEHRAVNDARDRSGGDGNRNKVSRLSPTFTDMVLAAADSSALTLSDASRLLRTKVDDFDKLRRFTAEALAE